MPQELYFLSQLINQAGSGWLPAVLLAGLLLAMLFKPDRVHSWLLLRLSCWLLAVSIIITPAFNVLISLDSSMSSRFPSGPQSMPPFIVTAIYAFAPILLGCSVICGLLAMIPAVSPQAIIPPKHPLE
jgi:hypothetical protein